MKKGIILLIAIALMTSCVSKHPKCAAYDKVQTIEKGENY
jgi:hypothetical protein